MRKFIITAEMRDLEQMVSNEEISYSKMIEIINEKAEQYCQAKLSDTLAHHLGELYYKETQSNDYFEKKKIQNKVQAIETLLDDNPNTTFAFDLFKENLQLSSSRWNKNKI